MWRFIKSFWRQVRIFFYFPERTVPTEREFEMGFVRRYIRHAGVQSGLVGIYTQEDADKAKKKLLEYKSKSIRIRVKNYLKGWWRFIKVLFLIRDKKKREVKIFWTREDMERCRKEILKYKFKPSLADKIYLFKSKLKARFIT